MQLRFSTASSASILHSLLRHHPALINGEHEPGGITGLRSDAKTVGVCQARTFDLYRIALDVQLVSIRRRTPAKRAGGWKGAAVAGETLVGARLAIGDLGRIQVFQER